MSSRSHKLDTRSRAFIKAEALLLVHDDDGKLKIASAPAPCRIEATTCKIRKFTPLVATRDGVDPIIRIYVNEKMVREIKAQPEWCHRGQ